MKKMIRTFNKHVLNPVKLTVAGPEGGRESMKQQHSDDQVVPYPKIRRFMAAEFRASHHTAMIHGLIEVDVSRARAHLRDQKAKTGESLSFTAFLMACLAQAVEEHKAMQARRFGRRKGKVIPCSTEKSSQRMTKGQALTASRPFMAR